LSEEDLPALEVRSTWDVLAKEPRVKKVVLAVLGPPVAKEDE
jgi:hypothetical protein